jgi:hypothetical protein
MLLRKFSSCLAGLCVAAAFGLVGLNRADAQGFGNPVVIDSGRHVTGVEYDPWNDQVTVHRHRDLVRASAWDPARGYVDPGSLHYVDRYVRDEYGRLFREQGYKWTSYGVPHGDLTKTIVHGVPGIGFSDSTRVLYSRVPHSPGVRFNDSTRVQYSTRLPGAGGVKIQDSTRVQYLRKP